MSVAVPFSTPEGVLKLPLSCIAVVGNSTLDFNYYGPVEEYATYVKSRSSCYINAQNPGNDFTSVCRMCAHRHVARGLVFAPQCIPQRLVIIQGRPRSHSAVFVICFAMSLTERHLVILSHASVLSCVAGSEIAGEAAAGLAAAYIVLKANNGSAAKYNSYLTHAKQLYTFATTSQGSYQNLTSPCLAQLGVRPPLLTLNACKIPHLLKLWQSSRMHHAWPCLLWGKHVQSTKVSPGSHLLFGASAQLRFLHWQRRAVRVRLRRVCLPAGADVVRIHRLH